MGDADVNASGWVCAGCGYALRGLDQAAPCPECGGWERRDARAPIIWRPWKTWAVVVLAAAPALSLVVMVVTLPRGVATLFNGFDRQPEAPSGGDSAWLRGLSLSRRAQSSST